MDEPSELDQMKRKAAARAVALVTSGMKLGLGTGSTARHFVDLLAARIRDEKLDIVAVPTSVVTETQARELGIRLASLDDLRQLDLTVDGADEIDGDLTLIKGAGGALLREKIVAAASKRMVVIADETKLVERLGRFPLSIEIVPFGVVPTVDAVLRASEEAGCTGTVSLRKRGDHVFVTDGGHVIVDAAFGLIPNPKALATALLAIPGVVETGLFIDMADTAIIAGDKDIRVIEARRAD